MASVAAAARSDTRPAGRASAVARNRPGPADTDIVAGLRAREDDALERLFHRYGPLVAHWARTAGTDVDDVVQDVMLKVWRAGARLEDGTELPAYLKTVTVNTIRNRWRTQSRKPAVPAGLDPAPGAADGDPALGATDRIAVEQVLGKLKPRERRCLELLYVSDLPLADVARELGASPEATKSLAARARRRIRSDLEKLVGPGAAAAMPWMVRGVEVAEAAGHGALHKVAATAVAFLTAGALTLAATGDRTPAVVEPPPAETAPVVLQVDEPVTGETQNEASEPGESGGPVTDEPLVWTEPPAVGGGSEQEAPAPEDTHERTVDNEVQDPEDAQGSPSNPGPDCRPPYPGPDQGGPGPHGPQSAPGNGNPQGNAGPPSQAGPPGQTHSQGQGQGNAQNQGNGKTKGGSGGNPGDAPGPGASAQGGQPHGAAPGPDCPS